MFMVILVRNLMEMRTRVLKTGGKASLDFKWQRTWPTYVLEFHGR